MASWRDEVILEGEFYLLPKKKSNQEPHKVVLTRGGLYFSTTSSSRSNPIYQEKSVAIADIIGCHCLDSNATANGNIANGDDGFENSEQDVRSSGNSTDQTRRSSSGKVASHLSSPTQSDAGADDVGLFSNSNAESESSLSEYVSFPRLSNSTSSGFVVFAYPLKKKRFSAKRLRSRVVLAFENSSIETYELSKQESEKWRNIINCLSRDIHINVKDLSSCLPPPRGKLLILINPFSGPGKAKTIFKNEVAPLLQEAQFPYHVIITEYAGHASELMGSINMSEWYAVVIVSGDGLIFETINGIMKREDWASAMKTPIGCIPGGSGNAMCCSINYAAGEPLDSVLHSTFVLIKHKVLPMDLVYVQFPHSSVFSFLSVTWGFIADIDYESEKYRNLGEARFTVGAIRRLVGLRKYRGRVSFLPIAEYSPKENSKKRVPMRIRRFSLRSRSSSKSTISSDRSDSPKLLTHRSYSMDNSGYSEHQLRIAEREHMRDLQLISDDDSSSSNQDNSVFHEEDLSNNLEKGVSEVKISNQVNISATNGSETNGHSNGHEATAAGASNVPQKQPNNLIKKGAGDVQTASQKDLSQACDQAAILPLSTEVEYRKSMTVLGEDQGIEEETYHVRKADYSPIPTPLLPPLDEPVPENWVTLDGDFVLVAAVYQTHLGSDMLAAPDAHLNDGHIHLMMVRDGVSRNALLNMLMSFAEGGHIHSPHVEQIKVLAFRLEPGTTNGNIMVDGERFDPAPLQAQILPRVARIMAIR